MNSSCHYTTGACDLDDIALRHFGGIGAFTETCCKHFLLALYCHRNSSAGKLWYHDYSRVFLSERSIETSYRPINQTDGRLPSSFRPCRQQRQPGCPPFSTNSIPRTKWVQAKSQVGGPPSQKKSPATSLASRQPTSGQLPPGRQQRKGGCLRFSILRIPKMNWVPAGSPRKSL